MSGSLATLHRLDKPKVDEMLQLVAEGYVGKARVDEVLGKQNDHRRSEQEKNKCAFTNSIDKNEVIPIPIAHGEGRFTTREDVGRIKDLIAFQFCNEYGEVEDSFPTNPNGSLLSIAGITNREGNVLAIMPHPERASFEKQTLAYGFKTLGLNIFKSMKRHIEEKK